MECVLRERKIKYENGNLYWWYFEVRNIPIKNPRWIEFKQSISGSRERYYKTLEIKSKKYKVHRVIYKIYNPEWNIDDSSMNNQIDHIDRDSFNNNIENLRLVTNQQNQWNRGDKGYSFDKRENKYRVRIMVNKKSKHLGYFVNEEDARKCYLDAKKIYHII